MNVALNSSETIKKTQFWHDKISECLDTTKVKYTLVMEKALVGLLICVYVKDELMPHVSDVRCTSTGVGLMGMMGNKGGVAVRLSLYDSSLCFVCAHLAAHRENIAGRNSDFKNIIERSVFALDPAHVEVPSNTAGDDSLTNIKMPKRMAVQNLSQDLQILDHEVVYWIGDLNYRIDDVFSTEEVFTMIEDNELAALREKDQLNIERAKGNVFQGFEEGVLEFPPTYKYQPGTDMYDRRPEKKIRAPAWCDRVLWRATNGAAVRQLSYRNAQLHPSDHKPVSSQLATDVRTIVESSQRVVFSELIEVLKSHTSNTLPTVEINGLVINLEKVLYEVSAESLLVVFLLSVLFICGALWLRVVSCLYSPLLISFLTTATASVKAGDQERGQGDRALALRAEAGRERRLQAVDHALRRLRPAAARRGECLCPSFVGPPSVEPYKCGFHSLIFTCPKFVPSHRPPLWM
jgi:phosphatidylinositol-bisphosphatase